MFKKQSMSFQLLTLFLFTLIILITSSYKVIIGCTIFILLLQIIEKISVKLCITNIKRILIWLIFIVLLYIILIGGVLSTLLFSYKLILILIFINIIFYNINYYEINRGINTILAPLKLKKCNFSYNIMLATYFINSYLKSKSELRKGYKEVIKLPRGFKLINAMELTEEYDNSLQSKFYDMNRKDKLTLNNIIVLGLLVIVLILVIIGK